MLSLLFDMNSLWEEYILTEIRKKLEHTVYDVSGQENKGFVSNNSLRPDIVIRNTETKEIIIIDTKWKLPKNTANVSDLRQMYTYARFWNANKVMLLYPGNFSNNKFHKFKTEDFSLFGDEKIEMNHQCKLGFVSVVDRNNLLDVNIADKVLELLGIN